MMRSRAWEGARNSWMVYSRFMRSNTRLEPWARPKPSGGGTQHFGKMAVMYLNPAIVIGFFGEPRITFFVCGFMFFVGNPLSQVQYRPVFLSSCD